MTEEKKKKKAYKVNGFFSVKNQQQKEKRDMEPGEREIDGFRKDE